MDEVREFCTRVLGPGASAEQAAREAIEGGATERVEVLAAAAQACRARGDAAEQLTPTIGPEEPTPTIGPEDGEDTLRGAVLRELALATAKLPERQREALALRDLLRLSHEQVSRVMGIEEAAVAPLLARARLALRALRRGTPEPRAVCPERERGLRVLARRQDSESLSAEDDAWLNEHLGSCEYCNQVHGAMLEASVCYAVR
jgi:hypothetical protein